MSKIEFLNSLAQALTNYGYIRVTRNLIVEGNNIELYATKKHLMTWRIFVMSAPGFIDQHKFQEYVSIYESFKRKVSSWTWGSGFILCILAETGISPDVTPMVNRFSIPVFKMKGGGGMFCIVDLSTNIIHLKMPRVPLDARRLSEEFTSIAKHALTGVKTTTPTPSRTGEDPLNALNARHARGELSEKDKKELGYSGPSLRSAPNRCTFCGQEILPEDAFCISCGKKTAAIEEPSSRPEEAKSYAFESLDEELTGARERPRGLTVIAIAWLLGGIYNLYTASRTIGVDLEALRLLSNPSLSQWFRFGLPAELIISVSVFAMGLMQMFTMYGLWTGKPWSYRSALAIIILNVIGWVSLVGVYMTAPTGFGVRESINWFGLGFAVLWAIIYWSYLRKPHVRRYLSHSK